MRCETPKSRLQVVKDVGRLLWPATKKMHSILILTMNRFRRGWLLSIWSSWRFHCRHIQNIPKHPKNVFPIGVPSTHTVQLGLVVASRLVAFLEHPRTQAGASGCCSTNFWTRWTLHDFSCIQRTENDEKVKFTAYGSVFLISALRDILVVSCCLLSVVFQVVCTTRGSNLKTNPSIDLLYLHI